MTARAVLGGLPPAGTGLRFVIIARRSVEVRGETFDTTPLLRNFYPSMRKSRKSFMGKAVRCANCHQAASNNETGRAGGSAGPARTRFASGKGHIRPRMAA